ncbi:MAG: hypothetical protein WC919_01985 [Candidatus Paceibacterota bacterium]
MTEWTPEFEQMWRCRLVETDNEKQPFREFIRLTVETEILEAFKMALAEIDRLRLELSSAKRQFDQPNRPQDATDNGPLCTGVMEVNPHNHG